jgi:hypothetical protein
MRIYETSISKKREDVWGVVNVQSLFSLKVIITSGDRNVSQEASLLTADFRTFTRLCRSKI